MITPPSAAGAPCPRQVAPGPDGHHRLDQHHGEPPPEPQPAPCHRASSSRPDPRRAPAGATPAAEIMPARPRYGQRRVPPVRRGRIVDGEPEPSWTVVVPVKRLGGGEEPAAGRAARRTARGAGAGAGAPTRVGAALACPAVGRVLVVTDDARVAAAARPRPGARVVPDGPDAGLNAGVRGTARRGRRPRPGGRRSPPTCRRCARPSWPRRCAPRSGPAGVRRFVADAAGHRHGAAGRAAGRAAGPALRARLGRGARGQRGAAADRRLAQPAPGRGHRRRPGRRRPARARARAPPRCSARPPGTRRELTPPVYGAGMQGTVATFDAATRSGTAAARRRHRLAFPAPRVRRLRAAAAAARPAGARRTRTPTARSSG